MSRVPQRARAGEYAEQGVRTGRTPEVVAAIEARGWTVVRVETDPWNVLFTAIIRKGDREVRFPWAFDSWKHGVVRL